MAKYSTFVGCDAEGDACIYIQRNGQYVNDEQAEALALEIQELLDTGEIKILDDIEDEEAAERVEDESNETDH